MSEQKPNRRSVSPYDLQAVAQVVRVASNVQSTTVRRADPYDLSATKVVKAGSIETKRIK
jgi:hypothetical protein